MQKSGIFKYVNMPKTIVPFFSALLFLFYPTDYTALHVFLQVFNAVRIRAKLADSCSDESTSENVMSPARVASHFIAGIVVS